jgi:hypothetical protein
MFLLVRISTGVWFLTGVDACFHHQLDSTGRIYFYFEKHSEILLVGFLLKNLDALLCVIVGDC